MKHKLTASILALLATCFIGSAMAGGYGHKMRESIQVADHQAFENKAAGLEMGDVVEGATILVRDYKNRVITANISGRAFDPDASYTVWWVVFNFPQFCEQPYACASGDLNRPRVLGSAFLAGGFITDANGVANAFLQLASGRTQRETAGGTKGHGLLNLRKAAIHMVYRTKGTGNDTVPISAQISQLLGACGELPNPCMNQYFSVHNAVEPD